MRYNSLVGGNENLKNYCCLVPQFDPMIETCPESTPYFNNKECIACVDPKYFNFTLLECLTCENGKKFSKISKICV